MSGAFLASTKKSEKKCTPVGLFLRWQGQQFREEMHCRGVGRLMGDLPNVSGRSKELKGTQTLSSSDCTRAKKRDFTSAEEVLEGVGLEVEGMVGGTGG